MTFMMLDADVVACSPASTYRVLKAAGLLAGQAPKPTKKGTGYVQPLRPHQEWHVDVSFINIAGTFYFLCSVLDGYSRFIVHWDIRPKMEEPDIEIIIQRGREAFPNQTPRIISDNGPQFIAKDFKEFVRVAGMTHVRTSPYYPQSNGKIERWHKSLKSECIRPMVPLSLDDAKRLVTDFVGHYNNVRLHSAIGYVAPKDKLDGRDRDIQDDRDRKLAEAREQRKRVRQDQRGQCQPIVTARPAIDFAAVRSALNLADVLDLLGFQPRTRRGAQLRGPCPLHGSTHATSRCFSVNVEQQNFQCFKCGRAGNALDLWTHATGQTPYDAAVDVCHRLNLAVPTLPTHAAPASASPSRTITPPQEVPQPQTRHREEEPVAPLPDTCTMEST